MSNIDNFTGKSTFYEITVENIHNPTTYDEVERFISTYNPSETIIISNMPDNKINDIINYTKIESKKIHKLTNEDVRVKNAEKQVYQTELLNKYFSNNVSESLYKSSLEFVYGIQSYVYLLHFVFEHNPSLVNKIQEPIIENNTERLLLANHSLQQLNIIDDHNYKGKLSSISGFLNNCITSIGMRSFKHSILNPTTNVEKLERNYDITEYLLESEHWKQWRRQLKNIKDIEKLNRQIYLKKITPFHLFSFYENLSTIQSLFVSVSDDDSLNNYFHGEMEMNISPICNQFREIFDKTFVIDECKEINTLDIETNFIQPGVSKELDDVVNLYENSNCKLECIREYLDSIIAKGEKTKKNDFVKIHETDKYGIMFQCTSRRGTILKQQIQKGNYQTQLQYINRDGNIDIFDFIPDVHTSVATGSNVNITNEFITNLCNNITKSKQKMKDLIALVYNKFIQGLEKYTNEFSNLVLFTSKIDLLQNMCYIAEKYNYCKPSIKQGNKSYIIAKEMRHPLIEHLNTEELYVSNDISIGLDNDLMLLYGTNAVGKLVLYGQSV